MTLASSFSPLDVNHFRLKLRNDEGNASPDLRLYFVCFFALLLDKSTSRVHR